jgi:hypothetical protein
VVETAQVPEFGHGRDGSRALHTPPGRERLDDWRQAPCLHWGLAFLLKALETFNMLGHRPDIFLEDDLLGRGGADDLSQPA